MLVFVDGFNGSKTKSALIKALQIELNKQFNNKLVVDGKWGLKLRLQLSLSKKVQRDLTWILQAALYLEGYNPGSLDSIFGKGTESALSKFRKLKRYLQITRPVRQLSLNCLLYNQMPLLLIE
ncbi:hypothetical protein KEH51_17405 [[Brevibacterium] frigoritolerans]|uniref:Peptidoglycan binding-like domain-containing protein n=1 Tax=Peribacillus frigoritolerans TaxID=450367 RepID=A0A941FRC2_9BACI|nr:hypothetical protein [Peribacillus frigoritolerans]